MSIPTAKGGILILAVAMVLPLATCRWSLYADVSDRRIDQGMIACLGGGEVNRYSPQSSYVNFKRCIVGVIDSHGFGGDASNSVLDRLGFDCVEEVGVIFICTLTHKTRFYGVKGVSFAYTEKRITLRHDGKTLKSLSIEQNGADFDREGGAAYAVYGPYETDDTVPDKDETAPQTDPLTRSHYPAPGK
jgi:hypothetical protein